MPLPDRIDTALMRPQLMFDTAAMMVPATACASGACRRHRRCLLWDETLGRPSCLSLLSEEEQAAYPARLSDAERALRIILADWPPSPSPDPDVRERQDAAIAIAARVIRLAPGLRPHLGAWLRRRDHCAPRLKYGLDLQDYRSFARFLDERRQFTDWSL